MSYHGPPRQFVLRAPARGRSSPVRLARAGVVVLFGAVVAVNLAAFVLAEPRWALLHVLAAVAATYLLLECINYLADADAFGILSPAFLATIVHFGLSYLALPTAAAFFPDVADRWIPHLGDAPRELSVTLVLAMLAAFAMWRAYHLVRRFAGPLRAAVAASPWVRKELRPNLAVALAIQAGYFALVAIAVRMGVWGYAGTAEMREANLSLLAFLNVGLSAGLLSLFLILVQHYRDRAAGHASLPGRLFVLGLIAAHVAIGLMAGMKSNVALPFVIAAFARFVATRTISRSAIALALVAIVAAYQLVEPYRAYLNRHTVERDVGSLVAALSDALRHRDDHAAEGEPPLAFQISSRVDLLIMSSIGRLHAESGRLRPGDRLAIQDSVLLAPVLALVPRAIWPEKPVYEFGRWFMVEVIGHRNSGGAIGMGPIAFLYMAGGLVGIVLGFALFGALQALTFDGIARAGLGGLVIYLSAAASLVLIPSTVGPVLAGILQMLPVAVLAQFLLLLPPARRSGAPPPGGGPR